MARRRKRKKGGAGIAALLIAAVVAAGYYFRDCLPNFGVGGGAGSSETSSDENPTDKEVKEGNQGSVVILIKGEECSIDGGEAQSCPKACESLKSQDKKEIRIDIQGELGAHAVVEDFKKCVDEAGFEDVTLRSP